MTQNPLEKLMLLAVASGMNISEFRSAVNIIQSASPNDLEDLYKQIRNRLRHLDETFSEATYGLERGSPVRRDVLALVRNAGMPASIAAGRIASHIESARDGGVHLPAFNQKEGLSRWLDRVTKMVGESALLNGAVAALSPSDPDNRGWTLSRP